MSNILFIIFILVFNNAKSGMSNQPQGIFLFRNYTAAFTPKLGHKDSATLFSFSNKRDIPVNTDSKC